MMGDRLPRVAAPDGLLTMLDSIGADNLPAGDAFCYAGYTDGEFADYDAIRARFPHAQVLSIAVFASNDAQCLDIESGDATPDEAAGWYFRQKTRGVERPCLYASADAMEQDVLPALNGAGVARSSVRLWSAHYTGSAHICAPSSCGLMSIEADGTQWTDSYDGTDVDASLLLADFFGTPPPSPPANWTEALMRELPTLRQGATGSDVRTIQALCVARGQHTTVDAVFGPATAESVAAVQRSFGIAVDKTVGNVTWTVLITGSVP